MRKITILLIACSLGLAGAVLAQQPEGQESPTKKGGRAEGTPQAAETKPTRNAPNERRPTRNATNAEKTSPEPGVKQHGARGERGGKSPGATNAESSPATETNAAQETGKKGKKGRNAITAETGASASPGASQPMEQGKKGRRARAETSPKAPASVTPATGAAASATPATSATAAAAGATGTNATATNTNAGRAQGNVGRGGKKVERQQIQQIKQQHASFKAQPRPDKAPAVTFDANRRIEESQQWQGPQYEVFRSYQPVWHDQVWYRSHYTRVELIGGGWYFWNNGYWFPAWGYDPGVAYYPYDGPIYVGRTAAPPDQVIADVQSELQDMGYYTGEVDGLLGPLTRQALRDYQADHGLMVTEAIDEPTLDSLQLS